MNMFQNFYKLFAPFITTGEMMIPLKSNGDFSRVNYENMNAKHRAFKQFSASSNLASSVRQAFSVKRMPEWKYRQAKMHALHAVCAENKNDALFHLSKIEVHVDTIVLRTFVATETPFAEVAKAAIGKLFHEPALVNIMTTAKTQEAKDCAKTRLNEIWGHSTYRGYLKPDDGRANFVSVATEAIATDKSGCGQIVMARRVIAPQPHRLSDE